MIESVELTLSHVELGALSEYATMVLFANALSHRVTRSTGIVTSGIVDCQNDRLYPSYYFTHLRVPPSRLLERHRLWDRLAVGVDISSFGGMLLDSSYVLAPEGALDDDPGRWDHDAFPTMRAGSVFVVDAEGEPRVSIPSVLALAKLPRAESEAPSMERFRQIRIKGVEFWDTEFSFTSREWVDYKMIPGRDMPFGRGFIYDSHPVIFAKLVQIMDYAEREVLGGHITPPFPAALIDSQAVLERETYYFKAVSSHDDLQISVRGRLDPCKCDVGPIGPDLIPVGLATSLVELYQRRSKDLVAIARVVKLLAATAGQQSLIRDAERMVSHFAKQKRQFAEIGLNQPGLN